MVAARNRQFTQANTSGKRLTRLSQHEFGTGARDCQGCKDVGEACASGGLCADGKSRCPAFEFSLQSDEEIAAFDFVSDASFWMSGMSGAQFNFPMALSFFKLTCPDAADLDLMNLLRSAVSGAQKGFAEKRATSTVNEA